MIADNCQIREARLELDKSWISHRVPEWCPLLYEFNLVIGVLITAVGGIVGRTSSSFSPHSTPIIYFGKECAGSLNNKYNYADLHLHR